MTTHGSAFRNCAARPRIGDFAARSAYDAYNVGAEDVLPDFNEHGYLSRGIHVSTIDVLAARFGSASPERQAQTNELRDFAAWARDAGVIRWVVDGSYVTSRVDPNDVDVVILPGPDYPRQQLPALVGRDRWPYLHIQVAVDVVDFEQWATLDFGLDRNNIPRGVVEIVG